MNAVAVRKTAEERRDSVIAEASKEFAAGGYAGTSTEAIARRVGVSQPYLFQLFGTKRDLFIAVTRACFGRTRAAFEASARHARAEDSTLECNAVLKAMGDTYMELLQDRDMLRLQLQAYAACADPDIREVVRQEFAALYRSVAAASGADDEALESWFAEGMLLNVAAAIGNVPADKHGLRLASLGGAS
ncbi:MAG TPA: TetR/AcrR family transcriptional regulator [Candidatus Sulfotelmatobacter sp.]|nr:TetR/AcrR family transcriptional regulator [Candidatus Sulfotelmatobacter sp.]